MNVIFMLYIFLWIFEKRELCGNIQSGYFYFYNITSYGGQVKEEVSGQSLYKCTIFIEDNCQLGL